ncbi:glutathione S-transferase [Capronia epimyces CBS 606.96]|uniref:Glutathione S-transferase n=1 Tax=Capronia epimyces CBS 606.96 TaxID=1182542 RepID=W9XI46_9EURO|nr:glutathione S-transferase [Capronia epimyces CBS 606.96]EXJ77020.1 glutathione S-transferase [Capronia epimyces CBS 606.96]
MASASAIKPIKVWGEDGPNPPKVVIILEELGVPYEIVPIAFSDVKKPEYTAINPNGRLPTIYDPNTDLTLWESGAIVEYLIERYDTGHALSFAPGTAESYHAKQWLYFQTTGQGPYFGQAVWFKKLHSERLPSAVARYVAEIRRVSAVLDGVLAARKAGQVGDGPWLVGNRISYADLAFIPWHVTIGAFLDKDEYNLDEFPHLKDWFARISSRPSVKKVLKL